MKFRFVFFISLLALALLLVGIIFPANGANAQGFVTSTPLPDGRIIYIVVEGDNCGQVALLHGITVTQLRQFNSHLDENCTLAVGQQLVVGVVSSNLPTAGPAPTIPSPPLQPHRSVAPRKFVCCFSMI